MNKALLTLAMLLVWFMWTDENGVLNLTDDAEHVPDMYIESSEAIVVKPLCTYERLTCVGKCPPCPEESDR